MFIENKPKETIPAGTHTAILYSVVDLGTQKVDFTASGGEIKFEWRIRLDWELPEEKLADGRPLAIGRELKVSWHEKAALAKLVKSWRNEDVTKGYDVSKLLGEACNITVVHNEKGYASIDSVAPLKKSEKVPAKYNAVRDFWLADFDQQLFDSLPDFLKDKIKLSPEYAEATGGKPVIQAAAAHDDLSDEIPF